jgi:hypothetical protein
VDTSVDRSDDRAAERASWKQVALVLRRPVPVFTALRDDSDEAARARQEPILAIVLLAGIAGILATPVAGGLLDDPVRTERAVAVWAFVGGAMYGIAGYFALGALVLLGITLAGSLATYRSARHLLAYAAVPLAASILLWLPRLALYGGDSFRTGGGDESGGATVFGVLQVAFVLWALVLLVLGIRAFTRFGWGRVLAAASIPVALPLAVLARAAGLL